MEKQRKGEREMEGEKRAIYTTTRVSFAMEQSIKVTPIDVEALLNQARIVRKTGRSIY